MAMANTASEKAFRRSSCAPWFMSSTSGSELPGLVDGHDAVGEVAYFHAPEASRFHHALERLLVRVLADRFGQVLVAVRVAGEQLAELRQHLERVEIVELAEQLALHARELQYQRATAGLEHATDVGQRLVLVGDVAQAEGHGHGIEGVVREGQALGVELGPAQAADQAAVGQPVAPDAEHGGVDVAHHHLALVADYRLEQRGDVAGAAGQIQHAVAAAHAADRHEMALPQAVDAERHQVVHQVVAARDRGEYLADQLLLLADRDVAETEMGGLGLLVHGRQCYSLSLQLPRPAEELAVRRPVAPFST